MEPLLLQSIDLNPIANIFYEVLGQFAAILPNLAGALLVFLVGWLISRGLRKLTKNLLSRTGIDKLAERLNQIELMEKARVRIIPSVLFSKVLYYILMLVVVLAATDILGIEAVSNLMVDIINYLPSLLVAFLVFFIGILFADFIKGIVLSTTKSLGIPSAHLIANFLFYFIVIAVAMSALGQAQIDTEFLSTNLTILIAGGVLAFSLGYGLASKDMMANFIASFYSKKKVALGDTVRIGEVSGMIIDMDSTSITLKGDQEQTIILPLSKLTSENVEILERAPRSEEDKLKEN